MPTETVNIKITGANPNGANGQNISANVDLASGNGSTTFTYTGTHGGLDTVVATIPALSLTSNSGNVSWISALTGSLPSFLECGGISTANNNTTVSPLPGSGGEWEMRGGLNFQIRTVPGLGSVTLPYLAFRQFPGLSIPNGAVVKGVTVNFDSITNNPSTSKIVNVSLFYNNALFGAAKNVNVPVPAGSTDVNFTFGGASDTWGAGSSIPSSVVNDTSFGFAVQFFHDAAADHLFVQADARVSITLFWAFVTTNPSPTSVLRITPNTGPLTLNTSTTLTVSVNGFGFPNTIPYVPVWEGAAGSLFLYDNGTVFNFGGVTYPPVGGAVPDYASALAAGAIHITGDNSAWQGLLSLSSNGVSPSGSLSLAYNGGATVAHTDITNLTITADDVAWFNSANKSYDLFVASPSGGGLLFPIQIAYMVKPVQSAVTVSPASMAADGSNHTVIVNLPKPISPEQQGLFSTNNTITATASASNGVTIVTQAAAILDAAGWLTGWSVIVHVPASSTNSSFQLSMSVIGTLTYLSGTTFVVNGPVTYLSGAVGSPITTTGGAYGPPSNFSFAVTGAISGTAPNYTINGTITLTAVIFAADNGAMSPVTFYRVLSGVRTNLGNGVVGSPAPVSGGYHTTATLSVATQFAWGTPLQLGYQATDALSTLGFTYLDTNTYNNATPSSGGGGGGGGGGCPTVDMWVADSTQVMDCGVGTPLDVLRGAPLDYVKGLPTTESAGIQWLAYSTENCYRLVAENGAEVIVSESTPVPTLESIEALAELGDKLGYKPAIFANEVHAGLHAVTNIGNGPEWSQLVLTECVGLRHVARLYCGGRNFAAGVKPGKYIYTHNLNIVK